MVIQRLSEDHMTKYGLGFRVYGLEFKYSDACLQRLLSHICCTQCRRSDAPIPSQALHESVSRITGQPFPLPLKELIF